MKETGMTDLEKNPALAILLTIFLICLSTFTVHAQFAEQVEEQSIYKLVGRVIDGATGEALGNVKIVLHKFEAASNQSQTEVVREKILTTATNERGQFEFNMVPSGKLTIRIDHKGYEIWEEIVTLNQDSQLTIRLEPAD